MTRSTCVASTIQEGCTPPIRLNVNLDAGLLLFWTLVYCCFGRCALSYGDGLWSAPLAALSVSNRVGSYP